MIDKLQTIIERYDTLAELMSQPDAMHNMKAFTQLAREHSGLTELVELSKNISTPTNYFKMMKKFSTEMILN